MHNGAYSTLRDAVMHHINPEQYLAAYNEKQLPDELEDTYQQGNEMRDRILKKLDPRLKNIAQMNNKEIDDLLAFLGALTDKSAWNLDHLVPEEVPIGLPICD